MAKDNSLIKNKVYLFLLAFYDGKELPPYTTLAKQIGVTRQTVSTRIAKLEEDGVIVLNGDNIVLVFNKLNLDVDLIKEILIKYPNISSTELENIVFKNIDKNNILSTLDNINYQYNNVVYGIVSEGIVKYVGCTQNFTERIEQHIRKRPFLTRNNFVILKQISGNDKFAYERQLINILKPE